MGRPLHRSHPASGDYPVKFIALPLTGAYRIELDPSLDHRGFFVRTWCAEEFRRHGLNPRLEQCGLSFNSSKGTLRGMHYQDDPYAEAKLIRCCSGSIYDVIVDLRPASSTYAQWFSAELTPSSQSMLYVPEGVAHGFQALADNSEVFYQMSEAYCPEYARGVRWNDPQFAIAWPLANPILSERDRCFPDHVSCRKC
jgi:dTDP-4-dehydrorhamnose 3,5-epimerase